MSFDGMPRRPARTSQREPLRDAVQSNVVGVIRKDEHFSISVSVVTRDGRAPLVSLALLRDGQPRGRTEIPLADLHVLDAAIALARAEAER